ncbi:MAG: hypothetical protein JWR52_3703 [Marmoricola sp.]|nr:hypothetical protein [Marmoricola sp.]
MTRARTYAAALCLVLLCTALATGPASAADPATDPICSTVPPHQAVASGPRIQHIIVDGTPVSVLLPPDYATSTKRYPVLYLLHGGTSGVDDFLANSDLVARTGQIPDSSQFIVATPDGGLTGFYVDWKDGSHHYETTIIKHVIPAIDAQFRTNPDRASRAIAGVSMGGWGAMHYAVRYPELFGAVGSLSGGVDNQSPDAMAVFLLATITQRQCADGVPAGQYDLFGMFGNPILDAGRWTEANPVAHAGNLRGMDVYLTAGTGLPCDLADLPMIAADPTTSAVEAIVGHTTLNLDLALILAGVRHTYVPKPCGIHTMRYFGPELDTYLGRLATLWAR